MNKEATLITSSPWKSACWEIKMSERGVMGRSLPVEFHRPEPNSRCAYEVACGKIEMFGGAYADEVLQGIYAIIDVNGLMLKEKDPRLKPGLITTGRGVMDGIQKSLQTTTGLQRYMRGRNGQRGATIVFQNICGTAKFENGKIIDRKPFVDSARLTLSKPLIQFLGNISNLRRIVEWGEVNNISDPLITAKSSGGFDFTKMLDSIVQIYQIMGVKGLWASWETEDRKKMVADENGYPAEMMAGMYGILRGISDRNADRILTLF